MLRKALVVLLWFGTGIFPIFAQNSPSSTNYIVKGIVESLSPKDKTITIRHEAIPNYMPSMVMPFPVHDTNLMNGLNPGDSVQFDLVVTPAAGWIDRLTNLHAPSAIANSHPGFEISHAVAPLDEGDRLPDFHFTNELGQPMHFSAYKGQALAITFFFTRCPFPDYCPRMTANFADTERQMEASGNPPFHLFSISFDPEVDSPAHLKTYAEAAGYEPGHWSFLTGDPHEITAFTDQVGEEFWHEGASIGHNLRTLVISPDGHIRRILAGNKWTVPELIGLLRAR